MYSLTLYQGFIFMSILSDLSALNMSEVMLVKANAPRPRVLEGTADDKNQFPFIVALMQKTWIDKHPFSIFCSGSLLTSSFVVTAAACLLKESHFVRCGDMSVPHNETKFIAQVIRKIPHPSYFKRHRSRNIKSIDDIGLIEVDQLTLPSYGKLHSADYRTFNGRGAKYAGFGRTVPKYQFPNELTEKIDKPLQIGEGVIYFMPQSASLLVGPKCSKIGQKPSLGDSGGPLVVDGKIVGICNAATVIQRSIGLPTIELMHYLAISPYLDWIKGIVTGDKKERWTTENMDFS